MKNRYFVFGQEHGTNNVQELILTDTLPEAKDATRLYVRCMANGDLIIMDLLDKKCVFAIDCETGEIYEED